MGRSRTDIIVELQAVQLTINAIESRKDLLGHSFDTNKSDKELLEFLGVNLPEYSSLLFLNKTPNPLLYELMRWIREQYKTQAEYRIKELANELASAEH